MTWVKLCGLRTPEDVSAAERAGADAIGFVTAPRSVRRVTPALARRLGAGCKLERFLVTEDETPDSLLHAADEAGVTGVQPHGARAHDAAEAALAAGLRVLFPIGDPTMASEVPDGAIPMLDGKVPGSGVRLEIEDVGSLPDRFVIAGGLTPDNVAEVLAALHPYGVDVSSGIEKEHGVKDHDLMVRFVEAVR